MAIYVLGKRLRPIRLLLCVLAVFVPLYVVRKTYNISKSLDFKVDEEGFVQFSKHEEQSGGQLRGVGVSDESGDISPEFLHLLDQKTSGCPNYVDYSQVRHPPFSKGKHSYPYMRPAPKCRTFTSKAVETIIEDLKSKVEDEDLGRLIENCLPNTLDTTILWHRPSSKSNSPSDPQSFVVTGDIHAEWLRDAARQLSVYQPFVKYDDKLRDLIKGAINTQAFYINQSPYCNAFHPPPGSGVKRGDSAKDKVLPPVNWRYVFECKYELDSLASFLTLSNEYYANSGHDTSFINDAWLSAYKRVLVVLQRESSPTFDGETGAVLPFRYIFLRDTTIASETLPLGGSGNPAKFGVGMVRSAFRPSDDACNLQFFVPANAHILTELRNARAAYLNKDTIKDPNMDVVLEITDEFINAISKGINEYGIVNHPKWGKVYAYEVDGYGSAIHMDDANVPSLLSLPDLGFIPRTDEVYQNTRKMILSFEGNPFYLKGSAFEGIGGPHVGIFNAWPLSSLLRIRTSDDDNEILQNLKLVMETTGGLGLMHETVQVNSKGGFTYTRPWYAWCNSEFGKTILDIAKRKPHLIFKEKFKHSSYDIDTVLSRIN
ncbi:Piso0_004911 [Millerozyma farinosa CBS 7064]|uniref:Piso0_004911 protein n=1 Tax=Pichia sorbitophila (strain ATCC MYA-4447 / BCRC 22081 / CBS 7064 / NBRC 10061 / NRRL Y-12695) TaxID=559304 RepID=G8Y0R9_PICSO|nr:Piso0_004911 [Millerozyma farinosa CBS 7064]